MKSGVVAKCGLWNCSNLIIILKFSPTSAKIKVYGSEMEHVFEEKDLGVTIDSQLIFEEHITAKVRTANIMVGPI